MKLKRFLLRFHPPGIILEYLKRSGEIETKSIDLLNLTPGYVSYLLFPKIESKLVLVLGDPSISTNPLLFCVKILISIYYRTDVDRLIDQILLEEPLISNSRKP